MRSLSETKKTASEATLTVEQPVNHGFTDCKEIIPHPLTIGNGKGMVHILKPYMTKKQIQEEFEASFPTVTKWVNGVEKGIADGRYPRQSVAGRYINIFALIDYMTYECWLTDEYYWTIAPDFEPATIAKLCNLEGETA